MLISVTTKLAIRRALMLVIVKLRLPRRALLSVDATGQE